MVSGGLLDVQMPLVMLHCNTVLPTESAEMVALPCVKLERLPLPERKVHTPVPTPGILPERTVLLLVMHNIWSGPTVAVVGALRTVMVMLEVDRQLPLLNRHCNT